MNSHKIENYFFYKELILPNLSGSLAGIQKSFCFCKTFQHNGTFGLYLPQTFNSVLMEIHATKHIHLIGKQLHLK